MQTLFEPLTFLRGPAIKNRFALAPLTNLQSHVDGKLSDDEYKWLIMRAEGGFSLTMTAAAHVQAVGQGFPGQLGVFSDDHIAGLTRLAEGINKNDSLSVMQLHHAGLRAPKDVIHAQPVAPSDDEETGARALSTREVKQLVEDFIVAAERAEKAGFDGVEIHGAHGYIICQFLSSETNQRDDQYGGSLENRSRPLFDIIAGIRQRCGANFNIGVRLTPERFGIVLNEAIEVAQRLLSEAQIDYLDMSLWDVFKEPAEEQHRGRSLIEYFTGLDRGDVRLGVAGKIRTPEEARRCMESGVDFILLGRAAILHHDFPKKTARDSNFTPVSNPVSAGYLRSEGLSETFVDYMATWKGFVETD